MAHYIQNLHLVGVLDELRDAYEISKDLSNPGLRSLLLQVRRKLLEALHESINLYAENAELHQQLSEAQEELRQFRDGTHVGLTASNSGPSTRKLS